MAAPNICGVCGTAGDYPFRLPPPETAPDLDLRPGEPTRSTLTHWVTTCTGCWATAPNLSLLGPDVAPVLEQPSYRAEQNPFLRWAAIVPTDREAVLQAAWFADDLGDLEQARACRSRAADLWGPPEDIASALRLIDVLRRAERFADALALADRLGGQTLDPSSTELLAFQRARIAAGDAGRHQLSSVLRPPVRTPHVAQGKPEPAAGGAKRFWHRLLRR